MSCKILYFNIRSFSGKKQNEKTKTENILLFLRNMRKKHKHLIIILTETWKNEEETKNILKKVALNTTILSTNFPEKKRGVAMIF